VILDQNLEYEGSVAHWADQTVTYFNYLEDLAVKLSCFPLR
jgi:hypothetical protein